MSSAGIQSQLNALVKGSGQERTQNQTPELKKNPFGKAGKQSPSGPSPITQTPICIEDMDPVVPDALKPLLNHDKASVMSDKSFLKEDIHVSPQYHWDPEKAAKMMKTRF